ncbi:tetratricopeptide repeat protein [Geobacter sp.]|uniref:tetratricopeptide repeat protein n=1 Tax=Geobacter sp. TaxID=46610 RepID=UPI002607CD6D|nr:tetratricopeptide repeat protein [Geobacter sp.]
MTGAKRVSIPAADHLSLGFSALERGDHQEALNIFRRAQEKGRSARSFVGLGLAFQALGDLPTARWAFYQALEIDPADRDANVWAERIGRPGIAPASTAHRISRFRAHRDFLEIDENGTWRRFFIKAINLGLGLPGYFPGEYPICKGTYLSWFRQMGELGVNSLRIYTIHPPGFYDALAEFNGRGGRLFLFQGVWLELPDDNDFRGTKYTDYVRRQIREAVDAVCGSAEFPERPGLPHGAYRSDVTPWLAGFVVGREWESCAVRAFNDSRGRASQRYAGRFLRMEEGPPFEAWAAETCDFLQSYEDERYGVTHPVTITNWPTLDPLVHPSESTYGEGLRWQGYQVAMDACNEDEDVETFDPAKISAGRGAGFFASYHVYPYYPDFLNNDYLNRQSPYLDYLKELKRHHGSQPVVIAEFGVPSSREITHWQQDGWHHGGHDEKAQGRINGLMMDAIRDSGMAGGMVFSWFDEWFKRNWVFLPYELPAERNPFWFNLQDAEQNYGLLAAYPGYPALRATLGGRREEWREAAILYEKDGGPFHRFGDGCDGSRTLARLSAQHDEGFFYLCLETAAPVDFSRAHYLIGLDPSGSGKGELTLPFDCRGESPMGLSFVIHLAGEGKSRILVTRHYDKYLNEGKKTVRPRPSDLGEWVPMQNITNHRRISKDRSRFYPSRVFSMSGLRFGSLDRRAPDFNSLSDVRVTGSMIELRIPWGLINVTDPSSRQILWMEGGKKTRPTEGIGIIACSYMPSGMGLLAAETGRPSNLTDALPAGFSSPGVRQYTWEGWDHPLYHTALKESFSIYRDYLARIPE